MINKLVSDVRAIGTTVTMHSLTRFNSASRAQMAASQRQQTVVPFRSDIPGILNGFEQQVGEYTIGERMPCNALIIDVIQKYQRGDAVGAIRDNPCTTIIFRNEDTGTYDYLDLERYFRAHEPFGMELQLTSVARNLTPEMTIPEGTLLSHTSNLKSDGLYSSSLNLATAYMSLIGGTEDGFIICEDVLPRANPVAMAIRSASWGTNSYPLNLYGHSTRYVPFAMPGEKIRPDKLIMATRRYDDLLDAISMLPECLTQVDPFHDDCVYGPAEMENGQVTDMQIISSASERRGSNETPAAMVETIQNAVTQTSRYYDRLLATYNDLLRREGAALTISPRLERLLIEACADKPNDPSRRWSGVHDSREQRNTIVKTYKASPLDEWYVELTIGWRYNLGYGAKLSDFHGCKGVVCAIWPREWMPRDEFGNSADVIIFERSVTARMNGGQLYEQQINAISRDIRKDIIRMVEAGQVEEAKQHLFTYYRLVSPTDMAPLYNLQGAEADRHLRKVIDHGIHVLIRDDDPHICPETMAILNEFRRPDRSRLTYWSYANKFETTRRPILIGDKAFIVLDKSSFKPMAVSVARQQHHGLPTTSNKATKAANSTNRQAARVYGESEGRAIAASIGGTAMYDLMDISVNPDAAEAAVARQFTDARPMQIRGLINRSNPKTRRGMGRNTQYFRHVIGVLGAEIVDNVVGGE